MKASALSKKERREVTIRHSSSGIRYSPVPTVDAVMVKETLGDDWLTPDLFRFGASTLVNDVLMQIVKNVEGNYQGADYFSLS